MQVKEQVVRAKEQKLESQHKKFYKIHLPRDELDKFKSNPNLRNFFVHLVFSSKYYEKSLDRRERSVDHK